MLSQIGPHIIKLATMYSQRCTGPKRRSGAGITHPEDSAPHDSGADSRHAPKVETIGKYGTEPKPGHRKTKYF